MYPDKNPVSLELHKNGKKSQLSPQYELEGTRIGSESAKIDIHRKYFQIYVIIQICTKMNRDRGSSHISVAACRSLLFYFHSLQPT
jgi:hypothetical protein